MDASKALAHNTALQIGGKIIGMAFGIATVPILIRYFGDVGYGEYTTANTFLSLFAVVVDFGLTLTTVQMISEPGANEPKILGNLLSLRLITGVIVFAIAPLTALLFPYSMEIKAAIAVGALAYFFQTTGQMLTGIYQKRLMMIKVAIAELVGRALLLAGVLVVVFVRGSLIEAMIALVVSVFVQTSLLIVLANRLVRIRAQVDFSVWKEIFRRSWPIGVSIFFNLVYLRGDILLLSVLRPQSDVGLYGGAYKVIDVMTALPVVFMGLALPLLVTAWQSRDKETFEATLQKSFNFFSILALPLAVGAFTLATPIMVLVGGEEFRSAGPILAVLAPALAIVFYAALFGHAVVAVQKQRVMTIGYAVTAVVSVAAYFLLVPRFGTIGAAWVTLLSESLVTLLTFLVVWRASRIRLRLTVTAKVVAAAAVMYLFLKVTNIHVIPQIIIGGLVYFVTLVALGGLSPKTIKGLFV
ncbi:MAG: flippase [Patescibacteria group bacterium]